MGIQVRYPDLHGTPVLSPDLVIHAEVYIKFFSQLMLPMAVDATEQVVCSSCANQTDCDWAAIRKTKGACTVLAGSTEEDNPIVDFCWHGQMAALNILKRLVEFQVSMN